MSKAQTKKELAEAGRRKLENFRRQKAEKKQPKAALPDEISGNADKLSKPTGAPSQPVSSPVKHASEVSEHQSQSRPQPSQDSLLSQPEDGTALHATLWHTELTKHDKASSAQLPSEKAPPGDRNSAPDEAVQAERDAPAARPRTARNLFSAGHPAPPPLPLPPTPNSRPVWMNARVARNSSSSLQQVSLQPPIMEGSIPFGRAELAAGSAAASVDAARSPAQRSAPAALGEALNLTVSRPSIPPSNAAEVDRGADHGGLSSDTAAESGSKAVAPSVGEPKELIPSSAPLEKGKQSAAVAKSDSLAGMKPRMAEYSRPSTLAKDDDGDDSWGALLARPSKPQASEQALLERAASPAQPASQQSLWRPGHNEKVSQPTRMSSQAAAGYADLSDAYASSQQAEVAGHTRHTMPDTSYAHLSDAYASSKQEHTGKHDGDPLQATSYAHLSDAYASSKQSHAEKGFSDSTAAADYAHLSDEYLGSTDASSGLRDPPALSGPPPLTYGIGSQPDTSGSAASSNGYAVLSDSYLLPPALEPRASGALPISRNAAMGPPSHSALDPIEKRQLSAFPVSMAPASEPPSEATLNADQQPSISGHLSKDAEQGTAQSQDFGRASFRSQDASHNGNGHRVSAAPARSLFGSFGNDKSKADSGQGLPYRPWREPSEPPPSSFQRPSWITSDKDQGSLDQPWRAAQDINGAGLLSELVNGDSRPSELSNGHAAEGLESSAANGLPPLRRQRSWSRDTAGSIGPAAPSPPVSVRGNASEEGFSASDGQMKRFKALQQHIDELTQEKYELMRGLSTQRKVQESLEAESERFASDFNRQAQHAQALQKELEKLSAEVAAQRMALIAAASERDVARASAIETSERLQRLAAEVVELEEKALKAKSEELKRGREAAADQEAARRAQSAAKAALQERDTLQSILDTLEDDKRALHAKLRRATLAEHLGEEHGSREVSTQTELAPGEAITPSHFRSQSSAQTPRQRAESVLQAQAKEDPSVQIASETMEAFQVRSEQGTVPAELPEAVLQLLPKTLYRGGLAGQESDVAADEAAALSNIHGLLDSLESHRQSMLATLDANEAEKKKLASANTDLSQRLESAQQRLELAVSRSQHASAQRPPADFLSSPQAVAEGNGNSREGAGRQLVMQSAPNTPAPSSRQLLRAPKERARQSTLGWFVDLLVPPSQDFQRIGPLT